MEKVLCAAIWYKNVPKAVYQPINIDRGIVICGYRHGSIIAAMGQHNIKTPASPEFCEQGFLTDKNRFLNRKEARELVIQTGQCVPEFNDELYSEDLY
jgi:hypothetical protein